jgi:hypothetical protein
MLINNLIAQINKIKLFLETSILDISTKTTEIAAFETGHLKYGTNIPIFPKLEFNNIQFTMPTNATYSPAVGYSFTGDDEIIVSSATYSGGFTNYTRTIDLNLSVGSLTTVTQMPSANMEKIGSNYYSFGGGFYSVYASDFSTVSTSALAELASSDATKNTFESSKFVVYTPEAKKIFSVDGSLDSSTEGFINDKEYHRGIEIGRECYANRFVKTARYDGETYFLDSWLTMYPAIFRPIGGYIYFITLMQTPYSDNCELFLGRWELL